MLVHAAAMDPRYQKILASKLQEHAHNYTLTDVSFRSELSPAQPHAVKRSTVCHAKCRALYTHPTHNDKVAPVFPCLSSAGCCAAECLLIGMLGCCNCGCALYRCQLCYPGCYCLCCTTVVSRHALLLLLLTLLDSHLVMHSAELPVILHS